MRGLLIAPAFFGYYRDVLREMESCGISMDYLSDRPSDSVAFKSLGRISYRSVQGEINAYFNRAYQQVKERDYDFVFFLGGMSICFNREQMVALKKASDAKFVLYLWDALRNCQRIGESLDVFDARFSFDPLDCNESGLRFLPLFYAHDYDAVPVQGDDDYEYDACFIGSVHQISKFVAVRSMIDALIAEGVRVFSYYYMPSRSVALLRKLQHSAYRDAEFQYTPLGRSDVVDIFRRSKTVIDAPQENQRGLTMRSIEAIGAKRRLATFNRHVAEYDFFNSGNIMIPSGGDLIDSGFFASLPLEYSNEVRCHYSVEMWTQTILDSVCQ